MSLSPIPAFSTRRLRLRPFSECDEALYCQLYTEPQVMRHIAAPLSLEAAQRSFRIVCRQIAGPAPSVRIWVVSEHASLGAVGIVALTQVNDLAAAVEMGMMLLPSGWGRGLAHEAQVALMDRIFSESSLRMIWTRNAPENASAIGLRIRLGFLRADSRPVDCPLMHWQMTRERWFARHDPCAGMVVADQSQ